MVVPWAYLLVLVICSVGRCPFFLYLTLSVALFLYSIEKRKMFFFSPSQRSSLRICFLCIHFLFLSSRMSLSRRESICSITEQKLFTPRHKWTWGNCEESRKEAEKIEAKIESELTSERKTKRVGDERCKTVTGVRKVKYYQQQSWQKGTDYYLERDSFTRNEHFSM